MQVLLKTRESWELIIFLFVYIEKIEKKKNEKNGKKIINTQLSLVSLANKTCIQENLLPAYTNIDICIFFKNITMQGRKRVLDTLSVRKPPPLNTNL